MIRPMEWRGDHLAMLDQRLLPHREHWLELRTSQQIVNAIKDMAVRGAPAIGIAGAYGVVLASLEDPACGTEFESACHALKEARPTAVNLTWAIEKVLRLRDQGTSAMLAAAQAIETDDLNMNLRIGSNGAGLVPDNANILTICNTGSLATAGHGTALGIIRSAHELGKVKHVWSCETRPRQQGLKLTAWELLKDGIPFDSIADSASASLMRAGKVDVVIAGADRIAANGDTANKIGTYMLAVLAHHHQVPFVIAAPSSTLDASIPNGSHIPIEERDASELVESEGGRVGPQGVTVYNPGFDVTPGELITAIVTEAGVFRPPYEFQTCLKP